MRIKPHVYLAVFVLLVLVLFYSQGAQAVRVDNLILSSAVQGQVLDHGKPVAGLTVKRILFWNMESEPRTEITTTREDGRFDFPEVRAAAEFGFLAKLFHVPTVSIRVRLSIDDVDYGAYFGGRHSYEGHVETGLPQIRMKCDLKNRRLKDEMLPVVDCDVELSEEYRNRTYD